MNEALFINRNTFKNIETKFGDKNMYSKKNGLVDLKKIINLKVFSYVL